MNHNLIIDCWRSGQIDPSEMVKLCRENAELSSVLFDTIPEGSSDE